MVIFTVVFGKIAKLPSDGGAPYPLMVFAGMLPWPFFSTALSDSSQQPDQQRQSDQQGLFPAAHRAGGGRGRRLRRFPDQLRDPGGADGVVRFCARLAYPAPAALRRCGLSGEPRARPLDHRAQRQIPRLPLCDPVHRADSAFTSRRSASARASVPEKWRLLYSLNPMVGVIDGFRWAILRGETPIYWPGFALSLAVIAFFLWLGITQFRKMERTFADLI